MNEIDRWGEIYNDLNIKDIMWQPSYLKLWHIHGDGTPFLIYFQDEYGSIIYAFLKRDLASIKFIPDTISKNYFDITTPYGYGGPLVRLSDNSKIDYLIQDWRLAFSGFCKNNNIISEFIRFHPVLENHKYFVNRSGINIETANYVVYVDLMIPEEQIWKNYEYNNQKNIKKAKRSGIEVLIDKDFIFLDEFKDIYNHTMMRSNAKTYYFFKDDFFEFIKSKLNQNAVLFFARLNGKLVSTELVLFDDEIAYSFLGGTISDYFSYRPNNLLKHELILWAKQKNIKYYLIGGGYSIDDGIFRYKKSFSTNGVKPYLVGKIIHNHEIYQLLREKTKDYLSNINSGINIDEISYFPIYRYMV
jgi:hypothetical protein